MAIGLLRWTTELVEQMPHVEGERYEIIQGELFVTTAPHLRHQIACSRIVTRLNVWSEPLDLGVALGAPGLVYADDEAVIPDVVWVSKTRLSDISGADGKLHDSPELIVEVLSPGKANEERDREKKLELFSRHNLAEYWIVEWQTMVIEVYRQGDDGLQLVQTLGVGDTVTSPLLPGFSCLVERMFKL